MRINLRQLIVNYVMEVAKGRVVCRVSWDKLPSLSNHCPIFWTALNASRGKRGRRDCNVETRLLLEPPPQSQHATFLLTGGPSFKETRLCGPSVPSI